MRKLISVIVLLFAIAMLVVGVFILKQKYPDIRKELETAYDTVFSSFSGKENTVSAEVEQKILYGPYDVVRVIDGDTLVITVDNADLRVRLIGVNTPESVNPNESKNVPQGKIASEYTKAVFQNVSSVYVEYDARREDDYGRTLAYVYLDKGRTMLQEKLLADGMARVMTIQPNSKYADRFYALQKEARENKVGFWAETMWEELP